MNNSISLSLTAALLISASGSTFAATLVSENFEGLALEAFQSPTESGGDGTDWTASLPTGWAMSYSGPVGDPIEFQGWRVLDVDSWIATEGNQDRNLWSRASIGGRDSVLVADADAYDDGTEIDTGLFNTYITTPAIDLTGIVPNSAVIEFDSFWRNEVTQIGTLDVSFDGGMTYANLLTYDSSLLPDGQVIDERPNFALSNPGSGTLQFRFGLSEASNDWWWAIDDVLITADLVPEPSISAFFVVGLLALGFARRVIRRG